MGKINNDLYNTLGDRWYTADDDPIALLRAESKVKNPWILDKIIKYKFYKNSTKVLDVGCGAGFLSNDLAKANLQVTGIDLSEESLKVAERFDETKKVNYQVADAYALPFENNYFDVLTAVDFLEHIERPQDILMEFARVLKPGGLFFFHTFNRNFLSYLIIIKLVEWLVKNTPKHMHVINLFIKPSELTQYCLHANMEVQEMVGIKPVFSTIHWKDIVSGIIPKTFQFTLTQSLLLSYMGVARKALNV